MMGVGFCCLQLNKIKKKYKEIMEDDYLKKKFQEKYSKCESEFEGLPLQLKEEIEELQKNDGSEFFDDKTNPITM